MIHLICGPIGAGKTTFAHKIANEHGAIRFSEDEWLNKLFVPGAPRNLIGAPVELVFGWASGKYQLCRDQIWTICIQLLAQGISIVLDGAAVNKEQRDIIRQKAVKSNVDLQLYYVTADKDTRRNRVIERNAGKGKTFSIEVTPEMFDFIEDFFEPPVDEELIGAKIIET